MVDDKPRSHADYDNLPIPTYDEAISRPSSSQSVVPPVSDHNAEREGLLSRRDRPRDYRHPTVESEHSSLDLEHVSSLSLASSRSPSTESLRRELEEMEIVEPGRASRLLASTRLSKHLSSISHSLSTLHLPRFPRWVPSFSHVRELAPTFKPNYILLGRAFALLLVLSLAYLLFLSNVFRSGAMGRGRNWIEPEALREYVMDHLDEGEIWRHLGYLTSL